MVCWNFRVLGIEEEIFFPTDQQTNTPTSTMFTPLDILYIVLAFCALWLTAAIFWFVWQVGTLLRNVNDAIEEGREVMNKVESALTGIQNKFDSATSSLGTVVKLAAKGVEYLIDKKVTPAVEKVKKEIKKKTR